MKITQVMGHGLKLGIIFISWGNQYFHGNDQQKKTLKTGKTSILHEPDEIC